MNNKYLTQVGLLILEAETSGIFGKKIPAIRFNLFVFKENQKGFTLLSGLKGMIGYFC